MDCAHHLGAAVVLGLQELTDEGIQHLTSLTDLNTLALRDCSEVSGEALLVSLLYPTSAGSSLRTFAWPGLTWQPALR